MPFHPDEPAQWQRYTYGSECEPGQDHGPDYRAELEEDLGGEGIEGVVVKDWRGSVTLSDAMVEDLDLRPGQSVESHGGHHRANLILRAFLAADPERTWSPQDLKYLAQSVVEKGKVLLVCDAFEHVGVGPGEPGAVRPSESPVFRSLAEAIVAKDPSLFQPGTSNLDWRLHAAPTPDAGPLT